MLASLSALAVLIFLLPGLVTDRIIISLTPQRSRTDIRLIIDSLMWAFVDEVLYRIIAVTCSLQLTPVDYATDHPSTLFTGHIISITCLLGVSVGMGLLWSALSVRGILFRVLRHIQTTRSSGRVDVWQDVLSNHRNFWLRVHMKDGSMITGWPKSFSDDGDKREIFLADATIEHPATENNEENTTIARVEELQGPGILLTERAEIVYIEVLPLDVASSDTAEGDVP